MPGIVELGHAGLHVVDLDRARDFYTRVLGLTVTDEDRDRGLVFLSSRPEHEHHELALTDGRDVPAGAKLLQQLSWRVADVASLQEFHRRFLAEGVQIEQVVTHGNAIGIYFFDPEGNRLEVYVQTGADVVQPFKRDIDLAIDADGVLPESARLVADAGQPAR
jgi:catechol-2,3-dioxygenase